VLDLDTLTKAHCIKNMRDEPGKRHMLWGTRRPLLCERMGETRPSVSGVLDLHGRQAAFSRHSRLPGSRLKLCRGIRTLARCRDRQMSVGFIHHRPMCRLSRSGSQTSVRRRWCGTAPRAGRCTTPSCGWIPAPRRCASGSPNSWAARCGARWALHIDPALVAAMAEACLQWQCSRRTGVGAAAS